MANNKNFKIKNGLSATRYLGSNGTFASGTIVAGYDLTAQVTATAYGLAFSYSGDKMYITTSVSDTTFQYSTAATATITWPSSIEFAGGAAPAAPANGETDIFTFSTDDGGTSYIGTKTADNLS